MDSVYEHRPQASTDPELLTTQAYRDSRPLTARQNLYSHQKPRYDLPGMVLEHTQKQAGTWVDVGCGNGRYLDRIRAQRPDVRVLGLDLSSSLLAGLNGAVVCADAAQLPLRTGSVQVVLAMHMLYHVADPDLAIAEAARVLTSGGMLVASTNSRHDKKELDQWWARTTARVLGVEHGPRRVKLSDHFPMEEAEDALAAHFNEVRVLDLEGVIEVSDLEPVLDHYASYRAWAHQAGVPFEQALEQVESVLHARLEEGPLRITTRQGLLVARV